SSTRCAASTARREPSARSGPRRSPVSSTTARKATASAPAPRKPPPLPAPAGRSPSSGGAPPPEPGASAISSSRGGGRPPGRGHTDANAITATQAFSSRAFAFGSDVFLGRGERATDLPLMAHEVTHVVQQRAAPRMQLFTGGGTDAHEVEARQASAAIVS